MSYEISSITEDIKDADLLLKIQGLLRSTEIGQVVLEDKPGCYYSLDKIPQVLIGILIKRGFDVLRAKIYQGGQDPEGKINLIVLARKQTFKELLDGRKIDLSVFDQFGVKNKIMEAVRSIGNLSIAQTLVYTQEQPRIDPVEHDKPGCYERIELVIIEGICLGYSVADIQYYLATRYFQKPKSSTEVYHPVDGHIIKEYEGPFCSQCNNPCMTRDKFCRNCGHQLETSTANTRVAANSEAPK